jgi:hypothetical protein
LHTDRTTLAAIPQALQAHLDAAAEALVKVGFVCRRATGIEMFLGGVRAKAREEKGTFYFLEEKEGEEKEERGTFYFFVCRSRANWAT